MWVQPISEQGMAAILLMLWETEPAGDRSAQVSWQVKHRSDESQQRTLCLPFAFLCLCSLFKQFDLFQTIHKAMTKSNPTHSLRARHVKVGLGWRGEAVLRMSMSTEERLYDLGLRRYCLKWLRLMQKLSKVTPTGRIVKLTRSCVAGAASF